MRGGRGVTRCGSFIGSNFHRLFSISDEDRHSHQWTGQPIRRRLWGYDSPTPSRRLKIRCIGSPLPLSIGGASPDCHAAACARKLQALRLSVQSQGFVPLHSAMYSSTATRHPLAYVECRVPIPLVSQCRPAFRESPAEHMS